MGCGASSAKNKQVAPLEQVSSVVPDATSTLPPADDEAHLTLEAELPTEEEQFDDCEDDDDEEDSESEESMPGEPIEMKWARAAKRKKKLARQRRRAAKAAKQGDATATSCISSFTGLRRPSSKPEKEGCFDRQCFLSSNRSTVDEMYDLSINLGKGTFGTVERCTHRKTKKLCAIKTIPKKKVYQADRMALEVEVMRALEHPHILKLYEAFEDDKYIYIVMELCNGGELLERILSLKEGGLSEKAVATVMRQVVSAVYYMHQQQIVHRDLKPENFLLLHEVEDVADGHVKVIDFGFSRSFEPGVFMATRACTNNYCAPEVLNGQYTETCDIWSLGVVFFVLLSGQKPFWGPTEAEVMAKVARCEWDRNFQSSDFSWSAVSEDAKDLIRCIMVLNTTERLTARQILEHRWIAKLAPSASKEPLPREVMTRLQSFDALGKFKRAAMTALVQQLPEDSISGLCVNFQALDEDGDGSLSIAEVERGLKQAGVEVPADLQQFLQRVDSDGNGKVDYTEFLAATITEKKHLQEAACWAAFRVFDADGDGKITKDEMALLLSCGRADSLASITGADRTEIEKAVSEADWNGDGKIDFEEFQAFLRSGCARTPVAAPLPGGVQ